MTSPSSTVFKQRLWVERESRGEEVVVQAGGWYFTDRVHMEQIFSDRSVLPGVGRVSGERSVSGITPPTPIQCQPGSQPLDSPIPLPKICHFSGSCCPASEWLSALEASEQLPKHSRDSNSLPLDQWEEKRPHLEIVEKQSV